MPWVVFRRRAAAPLGAMIKRPRAARESQIEMAEQLCEVSGVDTITRSEVSRWEREARLPSDFRRDQAIRDQPVEGPLCGLEREWISPVEADAAGWQVPFDQGLRQAVDEAVAAQAAMRQPTSWLPLVDGNPLLTPGQEHRARCGGEGQ